MTKPTGRKPGRPRTLDAPETAKADAAIGRTVWQLLAWGYSLGRGRVGMATAVAAKAATLLERTAYDGAPLSGDSIERIYKAWLPTAKSGWVSKGKSLPLGRPWASIKSTSRSAHRRSGYVLEDLRPPGLPLHKLIDGLLRNAGRWPRRGIAMGDPQLTASAEASSPFCCLPPKLEFPDPDD